MEDVVIEAFRGKARVHSKSDCHVAVLDTKPVEQVSKIDAPCAAKKDESL